MKFVLIWCGLTLGDTDFSVHCQNGNRYTGKTNAKGEATAQCPWITFKTKGWTYATMIQDGVAKGRCPKTTLWEK